MGAAELNDNQPQNTDIDNKINYLIRVNTEDITICREMYTENCPSYDPNVEELIRLLIPNFIPPADVNNTLKLFSDIVQLVNNC